MKKKVIAAGHICLDITPVFPESCKGRVVEMLLVPGQANQCRGGGYSGGNAEGGSSVSFRISAADETDVCTERS